MGDNNMEIFTAGTTYVIAALLVAFVIIYIVKQGKGGFFGVIISACEAVFNELEDDLKEYDPEVYKELKESLEGMKRITKEDVDVAEVIKFVSDASKQFERVAEKYGIEFKLKR